MIQEKVRKMSGAVFKIIAAILFCILPVGCAHIPPPVFPQEQRDGLGRLAVVTTNQAPEISIDVTTGRGHSAAKAAGAGAAGSIAGGFYAGGVGAVLGVVLAPVVAAGGAIYGTVAGPSADDVKAALPPLEKYLLEAGYQKAVKLSVLETIAATTDWPVVAECAGAETSLEQLGTSPFPNADAVMAVGLREINLQDMSLNNSSVVLRISGFAKLFRAVDGTLISTAEYQRQSVSRSLEAWGQDGGVLVRKELAALIGSMAEGMVDNYLLTATQLPAYPASLEPVGPRPGFCLFFCDDLPRMIEDSFPEFCWEPFPVAEDLASEQGKWLNSVENVFYDFRLVDTDDHSTTSRYGIDKPCYTLENQTAQCRNYMWLVRARFRVAGKLYATPWVARDKRNFFRTPCETKENQDKLQTNFTH